MNVSGLFAIFFGGGGGGRRRVFHSTKLSPSCNLEGKIFRLLEAALILPFRSLPTRHPVVDIISVTRVS